MIDVKTKDLDKLRKQLEEASDNEMMLFVPDVYQEDIYDIDYEKLKAAGVCLLTFDIDDTISDSIKNKALGLLGVKLVSKEAQKLFKELKAMGFKVALLTNAKEYVPKLVAKQLKLDGYIAEAKKPDTSNFEAMRQKFGVEKNQMAHIGNSHRDDVYGGKRYGIITCHVRRNGISMHIAKVAKTKLAGVPTNGQIIREELLKRNMWRRHHMYKKGDQYYQLGEKPLYQE